MEHPTCDLCKQLGIETPAAYDAKTKMGPWAHLCEAHYIRVGVSGDRLEGVSDA